MCLSQRGEMNERSHAISTVAQNFAADLDSMFGLNTSSVATLSQNVEEKYAMPMTDYDSTLIANRKANVTSGQSELEQLEAKLRETEQRLAKVSRQNSPSRQAETGAAQKQPSPLAQNPTYPDDRPPTGGRPQSKRDDADTKVQGMPGAMPETQGQVNGRDDYVMVENRSGR